MSALNVFVFQCEDTDQHALTLYRSGDNLPPCIGCQWIFRGKLLMTHQSLATLPLDVEAAMAGLSVDGYYLARFRSNIILFPR
jgi:hypothetical protein